MGKRKRKFKTETYVRLSEEGKTQLDNIVYNDEKLFVNDYFGERSYEVLSEPSGIFLTIDEVFLSKENSTSNKQISTERNDNLLKCKTCVSRKELMFEELTKQMLETFKKKNADYGDSTTQTFKEFGLTSYAIRLNDKLNRIKSFCKKGELEVKDESCIDTLMDMASYCLLAVIDIKNQKENNEVIY